MAVDETARLLRWEEGLLGADSLPAFLDIAGRPPGHADHSCVASFVLADPAHELRRLAEGLEPAGCAAQVIFVDGLRAVAPQFAALQRPWSGKYQKADHALLFGGPQELSELLMLPLNRGGELLGAFNLGARRLPELGRLEEHLHIHLSSVMSACLARLFDRARLLNSGVTDPMTGWHTRRYLQSRLREEVARCQRYDSSVACLIVDVDRLQAVNQDHGHAAGDVVLRELAQRIESQLRGSDAAAHYGSDSFAVLLPATTAELATPLARRILAAVRSEGIEVAAGLSKPMTVSIGIAQARPAAQADGKAAADELLAEAEMAMHRAKLGGGDGFEVSST